MEIATPHALKGIGGDSLPSCPEGRRKDRPDPYIQLKRVACFTPPEAAATAGLYFSSAIKRYRRPSYAKREAQYIMYKRAAVSSNDQQFKHSASPDVSAGPDSSRTVRHRRKGCTRTTSGCMTCRQRKKKCDETKPICRCTCLATIYEANKRRLGANCRRVGLHCVPPRISKGRRGDILRPLHTSMLITPKTQHSDQAPHSGQTVRHPFAEMTRTATLLPKRAQSGQYEAQLPHVSNPRQVAFPDASCPVPPKEEKPTLPALDRDKVGTTPLTGKDTTSSRTKQSLIPSETTSPCLESLRNVRSTYDVLHQIEDFLIKVSEQLEDPDLPGLIRGMLDRLEDGLHEKKRLFKNTLVLA